MQTPDIHLLRRLTQLENDLNGMCKEIHRRRSPSVNSSRQEARPRTTSRQSRELRRKSSPKPGLARSVSRGERKHLTSSPSLQLDQQLSAVLEASPSERRLGASREDCGINRTCNTLVGNVPSYSMSRDTSKSEFPRTSPSLAKSLSTTTAGLGSSSSGSCHALTIVTPATPRGAFARQDGLIDVTTPRCRQRVNSLCESVAEQSSSVAGTSLCKSVGAPAERVDLGDSETSRAEAKRDLLWQLELERLRTATLKLEVQREICESSDLRKRIWEREATTLAPTSTLFVPAVPAIPPMTGMPLVSTMAPMTRLPVAQPAGSVQSLCWPPTRCS